MTKYTIALVVLLYIIAFVAGQTPSGPEDCKADEEYLVCHLERCYTKCEHLIQPPACPSIAAGCKQPACLCAQNTYRNAKGECVPSDKCLFAYD